MLINLVLYLLGCLLCMSVIKGMENSFMASNRINIELKKKQGSFTGRILGKLAEHTSAYWGASLIAKTILLVIFGAFIIRINDLWTSEHNLIYQQPYIKISLDILLGTLVLIVSNGLFRYLFKSKQEASLRFYVLPMYWMYNFFNPLLKFFVSFSEFILKYLFNVPIRSKEVFEKTDIDYFTKHTLLGHDNEVRVANTELFERALTLVTTKVRKCMTPRNEIVGVTSTSSIDALRTSIIASKLSKIIVYENNLDHIIGYIHHLDLNKNPKQIQDILINIPIVPETMPSTALMTLLNKERKSIAWVIDEFGGTAGIVTMEDILEEIFGNIKDEYDVDKFVETQIAENEYIFSGRLELEYLNEKYGFDIKSSSTETLSGFIINQHESIPKNKDRIIIGLYEFDILLATQTRIETVKLKVLKPL